MERRLYIIRCASAKMMNQEVWKYCSDAKLSGWMCNLVFNLYRTVIFTVGETDSDKRHQLQARVTLALIS